MAEFTLGQKYNFYFGLAAAAPTTAGDETMGAYNKVGEIPGDISLNRSRAVIERRTRDNAFDRFVHAGDRTSSISFTMNLDIDDNAGYQDLQAAFDSDTDGVGASGSNGYWVISSGVASDLVWSGIGTVADLSVSLPRDGLVTCSVTIESENVTEGSHA